MSFPPRQRARGEGERAVHPQDDEINPVSPVSAGHLGGICPSCNDHRLSSEHRAGRDAANGVLVQCAKKNHVLCFRSALEYARRGPGGSKDALTVCGDAPLCVACAEGSFDVAEELLIRLGADANSFSPYVGRYPITLAARNGHLDIVRLLIKAGANVEVCRTHKSETALMAAAEAGHAGVVEALVVDGKADLTARNNNGWTPLHLSAREGHFECVCMFTALGATLNAMDKFGNTPLLTAVRSRQGDCVKALAAAGADVDEPDSEWITPLVVAMTRRDKSTVRVLCEARADLRAVDGSGLSALMHAVVLQDVAIAAELLKHGALVNERAHGETVVGVATAMGVDKIVATQLLQWTAKLDEVIV